MAKIQILTVLLVALLKWEAYAQRCGIEDLGFILDASGSLRRDFGKEKEFLKQVAARYDISRTGARLGVVSFSHSANLDIKFNDHYNRDSFEAAVDAIPIVGSVTRIDLALLKVRDELFKASNGARSGVNKALLILTDGSQTPGNGAVDPGMLSDKLRESGINVCVVGIGPATDALELDHLAGGPGKSWRLPTFQQLLKNDFIERVATCTCVQKPTCITTADVGFILDSSGSLRREYWKEKMFLKRMIKLMGLSEAGIRAGVVSFAWNAKVDIKFTDHFDDDAFNAAVDDIPLDGGATRIDTALKTADQQLFHPDNGHRAGAAKYLLVITDGSQTYSPGHKTDDPSTVTDDMKARGYNIMVLGIGSDINPEELDDMARPFRSFRAKSFDDLLSGGYVDRVKKQLGVCEK